MSSASRDWKATLLDSLPAISLGQFCIKRAQVRTEVVLDYVIVTVDMEVLDVQTGRPTVVHTTERVPVFALQKYDDVYSKIVRAALRRALEHELDEWLTVDGERATNPHPEAK